MTNTRGRFDRTLRVIIWSDLALSVATVVVAVVVVPVLMAVGAPVGPALTVALLIDAILLGGFGGVAAVLLMMRLNGGDPSLPSGLRLPLPRFMRPELPAVGNLAR